MKKSISKVVSSILTIALAGALLVGCQSSGSNEAEEQQSSGGEETVKITIATSGSPAPFSYVDEDNNITGYDVEVIKAVFERLPQYEYEIELADFAAIFSGLDSDKYQVGVNNFSYNEERAEKYIYTKSHFKNSYVIAVRSDNDDINTFEDLLGKTTQVDPDTTYATALQAYNDEHADNPINVSYSDEDLPYVLQHVEDGEYDFQLIDEPMFNVYLEEYGFDLKGVKLSEEEMNLITTPYSYILVSKGNEQLAEEINGVLAELVEDGTIKEISEQFFKDDFTPYDEYEE